MSESLDPLIAPDKGIEPVTPLVIGAKTIVPEAMCAYKVAHILTLFSRVSEQVNLPGILDSFANEPAVTAGVKALPSIMQAAPEAFVRALALATVPNAELETLFRQGAGAIEARVSDEMAFLYFNASADQMLNLAATYIPLVGIDALKNAVARLGAEATKAFGLNRAA